MFHRYNYLRIASNMPCDHNALSRLEALKTPYNVVRSGFIAWFLWNAKFKAHARVLGKLVGR